MHYAITGHIILCQTNEAHIQFQGSLNFSTLFVNTEAESPTSLMLESESYDAYIRSMH